MELGIYDIIKGTVTTPKAVELRKKYGKITFEINKLANKIMVREALEKIWKVKIRDVRIINLHGKTRKHKRREYKTSGLKKAIVTLKPGFKIELPDQYETMGIAESQKK